MAEASCEATCMAPVAAAAPQPVVYQVPVYAAPPPAKSFCQRLCECFCPPRAAAPTTTYYAAFPQAQPMMQPVLQPVMQAPAMQMPQAACPVGQTGPYEGQITNVQWSDGVVVPGESSGIQQQETPGGDTSTEPPMLPPAPVPPAGA